MKSIWVSAVNPVSFVACLLVLSSCQQKSQDLRLYLNDEIARLKDADPKADLNAALARGDERFLAVKGNGPLLPGIDDADMDVIKNRYGYRFIDNATIDPADDQEKELEITAWGYAEQYNTMLRKKVRLER